MFLWYASRVLEGFLQCGDMCEYRKQQKYLIYRFVAVENDDGGTVWYWKIVLDDVLISDGVKC